MFSKQEVPVALSDYIEMNVIDIKKMSYGKNKFELDFIRHASTISYV